MPDRLTLWRIRVSGHREHANLGFGGGGQSLDRLLQQGSLARAIRLQGVDVWISAPRRPWEASGTSGMKVLVNGGLNLAELDGWWAEACTPEVGWAIGDGQEHGDDPARDAEDAEVLCGTSAVRQEMNRVQPVDEMGRTLYRATVSSTRPAADYTPRITPHCGGLAVPFEFDWVRWQK